MKTKRVCFMMLQILLIGLFAGENLFASQKELTASTSKLVGSVSLYEPTSRLFPSAEVDQLQSDVVDFDKTLNIYITNGRKLDNDIQIVLKGLDLINAMAKSLKALDDAMTTVEKLIKYAQDIPQTEETANKLEKNMQSVHPQVTKASTAVNNFNDKITPARQKLESFDDKLQKFITVADNFEKGLNKYTAAITHAQQCINALPDGSTKDGLQSRLDKLAAASDKRVVQANKFLKDIIKVVDAVDNKITQEIEKLLQPIDDLESDIAALLKDLNGIINPLKDLEALFKKSFCTSFTYWAPTWKHPKRTKDCSFCIGFDIILQGEEKIKKEIEDKIGKTLYKLAEEFGIGKLVHEIQNLGSSALNTILKDLKLDIKMNLSGIGQLEQNLNGLSAEMNDLSSMLNADTSPLDGLFKDIQNDMQEMENIYQSCK